MVYKLSVEAENDLINIYLEGVQDFGISQAEKYHRALEYTFQLLSDNPMLARERTEITPPVRIHPHKQHLIVYIIDEHAEVFILRVRHGREDWAETTHGKEFS